MGVLEEIQNMMASELQCAPEQFKGRIIFMSMYNDIDWSENYKETSQADAHRVSVYARRFQRAHWLFLGPGCEQKWYGTHFNTLDGEWDLVAEKSINNMDVNLATKKAATKRIKQAVAEPIMARLEKLQARLGEITTERGGTKKDVSDRDTTMKRGGLCQRG